MTVDPRQTKRPHRGGVAAGETLTSAVRRAMRRPQAKRYQELDGEEDAGRLCIGV
jgi:hypothetical protein